MSEHLTEADPYNADWQTVPRETVEEIAALRAEIERLRGAASAVSREWHAHHYDTSTETMIEVVAALDAALEGTDGK
jgi:hypothetical protein